MHDSESLKQNLAGLGIRFGRFTHKPLFTVADGEGVLYHHPGAHVKNLFLRDDKGRFCLITALQERSLNLKTISRELGLGRFSFGNETLLWQMLGVKPGSVSPLALINAAPGSLVVVLDEGLFGHALAYPHPLRNDETLSLTPDDLLRAIESWGHSPRRLDLGRFPKEAA